MNHSDINTAQREMHLGEENDKADNCLLTLYTCMYLFFSCTCFFAILQSKIPQVFDYNTLTVHSYRSKATQGLFDQIGKLLHSVLKLIEKILAFEELLCPFLILFFFFFLRLVRRTVGQWTRCTASTSTAPSTTGSLSQ